MAIAAIAVPTAFDSLIAAGVTVAQLIADHHNFTALDVQRILSLAAGRAVLCTAKDAVKLRAVWPLDQAEVIWEYPFSWFGTSRAISLMALVRSIILTKAQEHVIFRPSASVVTRVSFLVG